jgi:phosphatidylethanolamine-binding protein (PEBP) family uncharacterized protein
MPANPIGLALRNRHAGAHTLVWARPDMQAPENFTLTSPAFDHGTPIPERHRGRLFGANISPALDWTTPPAETAELVLIVQDPDVPLGKPATHALTLGIDPALGGIPENGHTNPSPIPGVKHMAKAHSANAARPALNPRARTDRTPTFSSSSPSTTNSTYPTSSPAPVCSTPWPDMSSDAPDSTAHTKSGDCAHQSLNLVLEAASRRENPAPVSQTASPLPWRSQTCATLEATRCSPTKLAVPTTRQCAQSAARGQ